MKLLLDQGLPRRSAELLRAQGVDALHTGEIGMAEASDAEILERAHQEERTVITLDADFHRLLLWDAIADDLARGAVASVDEDFKVRVRWLPL